MRDAFAHARINLNLSNDCHGGAGQIKGRVFEVPACGGFLLTQDAENLRDYYEPGKEIATFTDTQDLVAQCAYWLEHDHERQEVARAGFARTWREHTFAHRLDAIASELGL
jgi:spore maturation protein CgeB